MQFWWQYFALQINVGDLVKQYLLDRGHCKNEADAIAFTKGFFEYLDTRYKKIHVYLVIGRIKTGLSCYLSEELSEINVLKFDDPFWDSELK